LIAVIALVIISCNNDVAQRKLLIGKQRSEKLTEFLLTNRSVKEVETFIENLGGRKSNSKVVELSFNEQQILTRAKNGGGEISNIGTFSFEDGSAYLVFLKSAAKEYIVIQRSV
jgi:hypothetical protein